MAKACVPVGVDKWEWWGDGEAENTERGGDGVMAGEGDCEREVAACEAADGGKGKRVVT